MAFIGFLSEVIKMYPEISSKSKRRLEHGTICRCHILYLVQVYCRFSTQNVVYAWYSCPHFGTPFSVVFCRSTGTTIL